MKRQDVDSSMLASVGYDEKSKTLEVEFNNGGVYQYFDVEKEVFEKLMNAESLGSYFYHNIRDDYDYTRIRRR
jgi:hypothetical protein